MKTFTRLLLVLCLAVIFLLMAGKFFMTGKPPEKAATTSTPGSGKPVWIAPDSSKVQDNEEGRMIRYGRALIAQTSFYLGPGGKVSHSSNGMNCQNCHLAAGTKPYGNNFGAVFATYPRFRDRRGAVESVAERVNDCLERSLNGFPLDSGSREMQSILAYLKWLGQAVPRGQKPGGSGIEQLAFLDRPADARNGEKIYAAKCAACHQSNGEGKLNADQFTYLYPPLWGPHSYNTGAGLYRLSRFAGYVKDNMPMGATYQSIQITDEEAWDLAAFVNSQPRPEKKFAQDWPDISLKPSDHPFGPFADSFSASQHKYGPFGPIQRTRERAPAAKKS